MRRPWTATVAGLALVLFVSVASAATKLTQIANVESIALKRLESDAAYPLRLVGIPMPDADAKDLAREHLLDLFQDAAFAEAIRSWALTQGTHDADVLYTQWTSQYARTLTTGLATLDDDEIATLWRLPFFLDTLTNAKWCSSPAVPQDFEASLRLNDEQRKSLLRLLRRAYLNALANQVPRPLPDEASFASASLRVLGTLPEADRDRLIKFGSNPQSVDVEGCQSTARYFRALDLATGDDGKILRRTTVLNLMRGQIDIQSTHAGAKASYSSFGGQFEPGSAELTYPPEAARIGIVGNMRVRIWVDEAGRATRVKVISREFNQSSATLSDGSKLGVDEMFDPVVTVFFRSGRFMQRFKDGKPTAYVVEIPMEWKLE